MKKTILHFKDSPLTSLKQWVRRCVKEFLSIIKNRNDARQKVVVLSPETPPTGKVLLSYIIDGFLLRPGEQIPKTHTNIWQSVKMAEIFVELGYQVEVIHYLNQRYVPRGEYKFFIDVRHNLQRLSKMLNKDCIRIMHIDSANIVFHNAAEAKRLLELQQRRGITLRPQRFEMPNLGIEYADYATTCGNDFTVNTFQYAQKKIFKLPSPCGILLDWSQRKYDLIKKNFLWFSSSGPVHKGLDLALEVFKALPELHLTVCGPVEQDDGFVRRYRTELFETANIDTIGWVDVDSDQFKKIADSCVAALHFSCSEGGAPSVKMCMHAGLIPIVSYETGVDVEDFGFILKDCTLKEITSIVQYVSTLPSSVLQEKGYKSWEHARRHHGRQNFSNEFRKVIMEIASKADPRISRRLDGLTLDG